MATDAAKHTIPAGSDVFDPQGSDVALAASIHDIIPVTNATDRDSVYAALVAAGRTPATNPVIVDRLDTGVLERNAGSGWSKIAGPDGGWSTAGIVYNSGWAQAAPTAGWQSLAYRRIGDEMWINGVVTPSIAWQSGYPSAEVLKLPAALTPSTVFMGYADYQADIHPTLGMRIRSGSGSAGVAVAIDLHYLLG